MCNRRRSESVHWKMTEERTDRAAEQSSNSQSWMTDSGETEDEVSDVVTPAPALITFLTIRKASPLSSTQQFRALNNVLFFFSFSLDDFWGVKPCDTPV